MKKIVFSPWFISCVVLYAVVWGWRKTDLFIPSWINGYLTDLLCIPFVLMISLAGVRLVKRNSNIEIKAWMIATIVVQYAIIFEWFLPKRSNLYTGDWMDVGMYVIGGIVFFFIQPSFRHSPANPKSSNQ